ncbi:MAG TPA: hypothetical protein VGN72_09645 [Tepidisphaeraceae bacterium]|jgi:hypothetical protein|nr:hypothetical protein [Tepidisphaeraceae bacterium]
MEQLKVLQTLDQVIFEIGMWPRDVARRLRSAFVPWRVHRDIKEEWAKEPALRFRNGISPNLFWILSVLVPYFLLLDHYFRAVAERYPQIGNLAAQPWPLRMMVLAVVLAAWPMSCSLLIAKRSGQALDREATKRLFATHCVVLVPASLSLLTSLVLCALFQERSRTMNGVFFYGFVVLGFYAQVAIAMAEMPPGWFRRIETMWDCFGRTLGHAIVIALVGLTLIMLGLGRMPIP